MIKKIFRINAVPWTSPKAKRWLDSFLKSYMTVFEFGSGGSTIYFARRVKKIVSVEYQLLWFIGVLFALLRRGILNFHLHLSRPEVAADNDSRYKSSDPNLSQFRFKKFAETIDSYPNHCFDLVYIDGRARNDCIRHAIPKVMMGGYIFLDDSDRFVYKQGRGYLSKYKETKLDNASIWKL